MSYRTKAIGARRSFRVSFRLFTGYGEDAVEYSIHDAQAAILGWMARRIAQGLPIITGQLVETRYLEAWPVGEGKACKNNEPGGIFLGESGLLYDHETSDAEMVQRLNDLAQSIGRTLNLNMLYISYGDNSWVLEKELSCSKS